MAKNLNGFVFHELMTTDVEGAKDFYQKITGLTVTPGPYPMLMDNNQPIAGLVAPRVDGSAWPSGGPASHWIAYFSVNDVDATVKMAKQLGGKVLLPPTDVPGFGRAAVLRDPQGAAFGIFAQLK
ncbi:VOC family protein [Candidatus Bathyarchaeota archaeon]|nr:VOC family protein [Candidatus Bathyarchaeota archaeon]